jgi:hypothetical protein
MMMSLGSDLPEDERCHRRLRGENDKQSRLEVSLSRYQVPSGGYRMSLWPYGEGLRETRRQSKFGGGSGI